MKNIVNNRPTLSGFFLLATFALTASANAQIANGSFESGVAYSGGPNIFVSGTPGPWFATNLTPDCYDNTGTDGWGITGIPIYNNMFKGMVAASGNRFMGFAVSSGFSESFKQVMSPLTAGSAYTISAQMAVDDLGKAASFGGPYNGRGVIDVLINGSYVGSFSQNTVSLGWESRSVTFVAPTASSYDVEFVAAFVPGTTFPSYMGLDDIRIVPEPGIMVALGTGIAALVRKRRTTR